MDQNWPQLQETTIRLWIASAASALAFHLLIQNFELLELLVWQALGVATAVGAGAFYIDLQVLRSTPSDAAKHLAVSAMSFSLTLTASIIIYRAFFHRLRRFPGPFAAKLSKLWSVYQSSKDFKYNLLLEDLHKKYGDVVRTGPRELSVARASALPQVTSCRKTIFYAHTDWKQARLGMLETRDLEDHRKRRRPWEMALGMKEIAGYDRDIQSAIGLFLDQIACEPGQRINITDWSAMLAYDLMGVVGFGKDFGSIRSGKQSPAIDALRSAMRALGVLFPVPWLINILGHIPGAEGGLQPFAQYCRDVVAEKRKACCCKMSVVRPKDVISWLIRAFEEGGPSGAPTKEALDEDARALVIAGAETTYVTLVNAFYYLAAHPSVYANLQREVDAACPGGEASFTHDRVKNLPLLDAVINETLRLKPPVPLGQPRLTPPEGLRIDDDLFIPGDVHVSMPQWVIQRDERSYERPEEFVPERWVAGGEKAGMIKDRAAFFPFQIGEYAKAC
ncbi:Cytochrome P450 [Macrophomina phaseolina MS6]|uniref:Cytochrome P450 n=1 Tax=Macrophomina phaseolina (strain MS6) TaxID=1126212 RepID=K2S7R5_MACPH|nr:Cytochrome P450 [Macrophomina phaseolina MS6]